MKYLKNAIINDECIACGGHSLLPGLDLGDQPPANNLRKSITDVEPDFPLNVIRCKQCDHLQLNVIVNPDILYKNYLYVSGTSQTYMDYMDWYANFVCEMYTGMPDSVLDIGCNDGSQLDAFRRLGDSYKIIDTYGVDPAENLYSISSAKHRVELGYWNSDNPATQRKYDIITSQNAFSHIPDPLNYLQLVRESLHDDGLMFISTSQADMVLNGEFDTIYHEHISYYNTYSMKCLAERAGLHLVDVIKTPIHGISYIFVLSRSQFNEQRMANILALEQAQGLHDAETYGRWADRARTIMQETHDRVAEYRAKGYQIVGYGAAAKGMTFITAAHIECDVIIDDNPLKQGRYVPGLDTPITDSGYLTDQLESQDKVLFIPLAWNVFREIRSKIRTLRRSPNDRFLRYFPTIEIGQ
jgi:2-polyprenyl-3-methyl-5-hydroxy-6-metoxy-1,4-benzoquinol methylase